MDFSSPSQTKRPFIKSEAVLTFAPPQTDNRITRQETASEVVLATIGVSWPLNTPIRLPEAVAVTNLSTHRWEMVKIIPAVIRWRGMIESWGKTLTHQNDIRNQAASKADCCVASRLLLQSRTSTHCKDYDLRERRCLSSEIQTVVRIKQHFLTPLWLTWPLQIDNMSDKKLQMALAKRQRRDRGKK